MKESAEAGLEYTFATSAGIAVCLVKITDSLQLDLSVFHTC